MLPSLAAGCGEASAELAGQAALHFDPCAPLALVLDAAVTAEQRSGTRAAIALWNDRASARLSVTDQSIDDMSGEPALPVHFQPAAAPSHGFYDPGAGNVLINDDLTAHPLAVTLAHELGHAFGLAHVSDRSSVMRAGNLDIEPNDADIAALAGLWGRCLPAAAGPRD